MGVWDHVRPDDQWPAETAGPVRNGTRVRLERRGVVSFVRSGFALVRWDDGLESSEWCPGLTVEEK